MFENTEPDVAIWVSLADLQVRTLEDYLLQVWLKRALKTARVTPEMEDSFVELFNRERVWLVLDGVDEMSVETGNPLTAIASQLTTGWISNARVLLTCRLNVWDAGKNALERFDTYRTLEFSYGDRNKPDSDQVNQFLINWFASSNPHLGKALRAALDQPGKERIKDLVKNPLRLSLMSYSWQLRQGKLPKTKAALYQRFVEAFYEWKQEHFPSDSVTRKQLNQALGRLAKVAISQSYSRFRLTRRFVLSVLGESDTPLFQLAMQLGWLNQVGVAEEDPEEPVYAFYHPTFEEYFAACAIDDWHFFLTHVPNNPNAGIYRIFEPQWKEVILLWLGREDVAKEKKEEFIKALVEFDDGCCYFFCYQAYFLAAAGISEFVECNRTNEILRQLVSYAFGYLNEEQKWVTYVTVVGEEARKVFKETNRDKVVPDLVKLITTIKDEYICILAVDLLREIDPENPTIIKFLVQIIQNTNNEGIRWMASVSLKQISPGYPIVVNTLVPLIERTDDLNVLTLLNQSLGEIDNSHPTYLNNSFHLLIEPFVQSIFPHNTDIILEEIFSEPTSLEDESEYILLFDLIFQLIPDQLISKEFTSWENTIYEDLTQCLRDFFFLVWKFSRLWGQGQIKVDNQTTLTSIEKLVQNSESKLIRLYGAFILGSIQPSHKTAVAIVIDLILTSQDETDCLLAAFILNYIKPKEQLAINTVIKLINIAQNENVWLGANCLLALIEPSNKIAIDFQSSVIQSFPEDSTLNVREKFMFWILSQKIAVNLGKANLADATAIATLINIIKIINNDSIYTTVAESLKQIGMGNKTPITSLINLLTTNQNENTRRGIANSLPQILEGEQFTKVVIELKDYLKNDVWENDRSLFDNCYSLVWRCAENMSYLEFYRAWHGESATVESSENLIADIASQLQPSNKIYPIVINCEALQNETDISAISQELCNQIYLTIFPNNPEIPAVNNAPQFKRIILPIKKRLQTQHLALIINNCEPNQALITFSRKLTDVLHIAWITDKFLEAPLRGFSSAHPNLVSVIKSWINEIE